MTVIDSQGNLHDTAGKFSEKHNSAPSSLLPTGYDDSHNADVRPSVNIDEALHTPVSKDLAAKIRTADFTVASLSRQHGAIHTGTYVDDDGHPHYVLEGIESDDELDLVIDEGGEIVSVKRMLRTRDGDQFEDHSWDGSFRERLIEDVHLDRLRAAGVLVNSTREDNDDPRYYPAHFIGGRVSGKFPDAAQVSKDTRGGIKRAIELGVLPADYSYRVTSDKFSGGQAIRITVEGMPDSELRMPHFDGERMVNTPKSRRISNVIEAIGKQWNVDRSQSQIDYFDTNYYCTVSIRDERETAWWQAERAKKAAARKKG